MRVSGDFRGGFGALKIGQQKHGSIRGPNKWKGLAGTQKRLIPKRIELITASVYAKVENPFHLIKNRGKLKTCLIPHQYQSPWSALPQIADRMGLSNRQLQDLRLRDIGLLFVRLGLSIHYPLADVQDIEGTWPRCSLSKYLPVIALTLL